MKLKLDIEQVRVAVKKYRPRNTRNEYHFANLNVKVISIIHQQELERDSFTVQIRMPCIEVLSEILEDSPARDSTP